MPELEHEPEYRVYGTMLAKGKGIKHPERYILGKRHPDRAKQFKSFAALRGYDELIDQVIAEAAKSDDVPKTDTGSEACYGKSMQSIKAEPS